MINVNYILLEVNFCEKCFNCQLSPVDPKKMFSNYLYTSSTSKIFRNHFINAVKKYIKELKLNKKNPILLILAVMTALL